MQVSQVFENRMCFGFPFRFFEERDFPEKHSLLLPFPLHHNRGGMVQNGSPVLRAGQGGNIRDGARFCSQKAPIVVNNRFLPVDFEDSVAVLQPALRKGVCNYQTTSPLPNSKSAVEVPEIAGVFHPEGNAGNPFRREEQLHEVVKVPVLQHVHFFHGSDRSHTLVRTVVLRKAIGSGVVVFQQIPDVRQNLRTRHFLDFFPVQHITPQNDIVN